MKLPSIKNLAEGAYAVCRRFPFEVLFAFVGTIAATVYTELESTNRIAENWCVRVLMIANLGLLLSLATSLYTESKKTPARHCVVLKIAAALFAIALIFILNPFDHTADHIRFFLISLSFHLLVAFAAFTVKGHLKGFWQFNKALFLRFLTGVLYSGVLFSGIAAAIGAMNFLFNFKFEWDTFAILWIWIVGMFNTLFFLAGVPDDLQALDNDESYPRGLKVFTQYVLIPLATLYVVILLAYEIKILVQWNLPKGLVSDLILGYAVFGILSILLVYPIREQEENKWIKSYARSFYFLMLPLIALLLLAAGTRILRYGITEWRYFLMVLAGWLLLITVYFLISKKQNIKRIPISLCVLTLLAVYGPQSAFSVSEYSQQRILINVFKRNHAFKDGKLIPVDSMKISKKDGNRAVAALDYLVSHHDLSSLSSYVSVDLDKVGDSLSKQKGRYNEGFEVSKYELRANKLIWIKKYLHVNRFWGNDRYDVMDTASMLNNGNFASTANILFTVKGYDYWMDARFYTKGITDTVLNHIKIHQYNTGNNFSNIKLNNKELVFNIKAHVNELLKDQKRLDKFKDMSKEHNYQNSYNIPADLLNMKATSAHFEVLLKINNISFELTQGHQVSEISFVNADYLIKVKQ